MLLYQALRTREIYFALLTTICACGSAFAGEFEVSGSHNFVRSPGKPEAQTVDFAAPGIGQHYVLRIYNGENAEDLVTSARVMLNGTEYFSPEDFKKSATFLDTPLLSLELENSLYVMLDGQPGSGLAAEVIGIDNIAPTISATIDPVANSAGWHNSDVTVSFSCEDELSGIEACTSPITVGSEGGAQEVTGEAVDRAGNKSISTVVVNLDTTPPLLSSLITPEANENGWQNKPVTITYNCTDSLSGILECPESTGTSLEGANQVISVSAMDKAGNVSEIEDLISTDFTAPTISAEASPAPNPSGWNNSPVSVSYTCSDELSGVESCPDVQLFSGDGANQAATGTAIDKAGNTADASVTFNIDQVAPKISFISPAGGELLTSALSTIQLLISDNIELDQGSFRITVNGSDSSNCSVADGRAVCTSDNPLPVDTALSVTAQISDIAGNQTEVTISTAIDTDQDSVADYLDQCPGSGLGQDINESGCSLLQLDSDNDGINDAEELAAGTDPYDSSSFPSVSIESFSVSHSVIDSAGEPVKIQWRVTGAQAVSLSSDAGEVEITDLENQGSLTVEPEFTTTYTLRAVGPAENKTESLTVTLDVQQPPTLWEEPNLIVQENIATSLSVTEDGTAYVGAFDGNFYKINSRGEIDWTLEDTGTVMGKAVFAGDRVIFGANVSGSGRLESLGRVYAIGHDKALQWSIDTAGAVVATPTLSVDKATVYVVSYSGNVYAINIQSGNRLWEYSIPGNQTVTARPAIVGNKLIVNTESNQLIALDSNASSDSARVLWTKSL